MKFGVRPAFLKAATADKRIDAIASVSRFASSSNLWVQRSRHAR